MRVKFFGGTTPEKSAMLICKITLPDSPHPVIISINPGFRALYLAIDRMNSFISFNKYKKYIFFSFLAAGFCTKKIAFARKIMALPKSGELQPPSAPWLVRLCFSDSLCDIVHCALNSNTGVF